MLFYKNYNVYPIVYMLVSLELWVPISVSELHASVWLEAVIVVIQELH